MADKLLDNTAAVQALTSPAWTAALAQINIALSFVSLVLGMAFLLWRWYHAKKEKDRLIEQNNTYKNKKNG